VLVAAGDTIHAEDLGLGTAPFAAGPALAAEADELGLAEKVRIERALAEAGGIVAKAAESLGLSRQALYRKMEKHGLTVERRLRG
jgi:DNA-binding NtrC family response regulator